MHFCNAHRVLPLPLGEVPRRGGEGVLSYRGYTPSVMAFAMPAPPEVEPSPFGDKGLRTGRPLQFMSLPKP